MIYYPIEQNFKECKSLQGYSGDFVVIISEKELQEKIESKEIDVNDVIPFKNAKCCRAMVRPKCLSMCFSIISKDKKMVRNNFGIIFTPGNITFIDNNNFVASVIKKMNKTKFHGGAKTPRFLYDFLETLIDSDLRYMEEMGDRLEKIEAAVIRGILSEFNMSMLKFKKEVMLFYRYYTQLMDLAEELCENENGFFHPDDMRFFENFSKRARSLREEMQFLRETSNQLRDVYSSQVDFKTNRTMKFLTVVTSIITPTTLFTSWYGMNFSTMPELDSPHGYTFFILGNVVLTGVCLWYLKKKKIL